MAMMIIFGSLLGVIVQKILLNAKWWSYSIVLFVLHLVVISTHRPPLAAPPWYSSVECSLTQQSHEIVLQPGQENSLHIYSRRSWDSW
jgi:hypothetical protein